MTKLASTAAVLLALVSPAAAFNAVPDAVTVGPSTMLVCHPQLDRSDRDPVVRTYVQLELDQDHKPWPGSIKTFTVQHELLSGRMIQRDDQYSARGGLTSGNNTADFWWLGELAVNHSIWMKGHLFKSANYGWGYQETVFKNGYVEKTLPAMLCTEQVGD